jgi:hypothetical protein
MLPSMKIQNGSQIQDGRQNVFILSNLISVVKPFFSKNTFSKKFKWSKIQYGRFFSKKIMISWWQNR